MKTRFYLTNILLAAYSMVVLAGTVTTPDKLPAYYSDVDGKSGSSLFSAVNTVTVKGFKSLGYDGALTAYEKTDVYPVDSTDKKGLIWDMYGACGFNTSKTCGNYSGECDCYNREHSIPKSWWGGNKNETYSDIFHLVPTDGYVNNRRSNYAFGEVDNVTYSYMGAKLGSPKTISTDNTMKGSLSLSCSSNPVFEPIDQYKGDFARGYFGILAHYTSLSITSGAGGSMFNGASGSTNTFGLSDYGLALLLKWHRMDPVSQKEIDRNNGIQETQGNRNPFIDYPDLVEYIWGSHAGEKFELASATATFSDDYDPTSGGGGNVEPPVVEPFDFILYCNGQTQTITGNTEPYTLKTVANACDDWLFDGWSATKVEKTNSKPDYITTVKEATTVYAVYKNTVTSGEGSTEKALKFADLGYSNGSDVTSVDMDNCTLTFAKNSGSNAPKYYNSGSAVRLYPKNSLTITSESEITKVVFETVNSYEGTISVTDGEYAEGTWTGSSQEITFKHEPSGNAQWRIVSVTVTTGGGSTTITYASDAECSTVAPCEGQLATPNVTATAGDAQITLTWEEVTNADHYEVTLSEGIGFTTECSDPIIGEIILSGITNTCIITGLVNGLAYTTTVKAIGTSVCNSEADEDITIPAEGATGPTTSMETTDETHVQIFVNEGTVRSNGFVRIYDITGKEVTRINGTLSRGIYIIRTSEGAQKVLVP